MTIATQKSSPNLVRPTLPTVGTTLADLRKFRQNTLDYALKVCANPASCYKPLVTEEQRSKFRASLDFLDFVIQHRCQTDTVLNAAYNTLFAPVEAGENASDNDAMILTIVANATVATDGPEAEAYYLDNFLRMALGKAFTEIADLIHAEMLCDDLIELVLNHENDTRPLNDFLSDVAFVGTFTILHGGASPLLGNSDDSKRYVAVVTNPTWRTLLSCADAAIETTRDHHHKYLETIDISKDIEPMTGTRRIQFTFGS